MKSMELNYGDMVKVIKGKYKNQTGEYDNDFDNTRAVIMSLEIGEMIVPFYSLELLPPRTP